MSILPAPNEGRAPLDSEPLAEVIPLVPRLPETAEVADLEPAERVELFFAQFRHPSISHREPEDIAAIIRRQLYDLVPKTELEKLSVDDLSMRQALLPFCVDSSVIDEDSLDKFSEQDEIYAQLTRLTMETRARAKDFPVRRQALLALEEFRLGTKVRSGGDIAGSDEDWLRVIYLLFPEQR